MKNNAMCRNNCRQTDVFYSSEQWVSQQWCLIAFYEDLEGLATKVVYFSQELP